MNAVTVQVAVLDSDRIAAPVKLDAHVINFDLQELSLQEFVDVFYYGDGSSFKINPNPGIKALELQTKSVNNVPIRLSSVVLSSYGEDLGVDIDCIDPCCLIEIQSQLSGYKTMSDLCAVTCSLTLNEVVTQIVQHNASYNEESALKNKSHVLVINVRFTNAGDVKDVIAKFNFLVNFGAESEASLQALAIEQSVNEESGKSTNDFVTLVPFSSTINSMFDVISVLRSYLNELGTQNILSATDRGFLTTYQGTVTTGMSTYASAASKSINDYEVFKNNMNSNLIAFKSYLTTNTDVSYVKVALLTPHATSVVPIAAATQYPPSINSAEAKEILDNIPEFDMDGPEEWFAMFKDAYAKWSDIIKAGMDDPADFTNNTTGSFAVWVGRKNELSSSLLSGGSGYTHPTQAVSGINRSQLVHEFYAIMLAYNDAISTAKSNNETDLANLPRYMKVNTGLEGFVKKYNVIEPFLIEPDNVPFKYVV